MKKIDVTKIIVIIAGIIALVGLFLPYEKSTKEYRKELKKQPEVMNIEEIKFTNKDAMDISIIENFKIYNYSMNHDIGVGNAKEIALVNVIITVILVVSIILVLLFAILNKKIATIIFGILLAISSLAMNFDIVDRGVIPSSRYTYGIAYYLYIVLAIIIVVSTIISMIKNKKQIDNDTNTK